MSLTVKYLKGKKFEVKCRSHIITVDQQKSKKGTDQGMDPVELFNAALAACAAFFGMTFLSRRTKDLNGLEVESSWNFAENPHRVGGISLTVKLPWKISESERKGLLRSVEHCTVKNTLEHPPNILIELSSFREEVFGG
jgi:ribosomal protein S12 methylthiotransferase accessory factor